MVSLPGRTIGSPSRALEAPTGVLTIGHLLLTLLTWRGPCGSVWLSGFSTREECSLGPALKTLAGKVSMQLSQASSSACWCQPLKEGQEDRGRAGQLCWHPKDPQRFLCLPFRHFNSILKKFSSLDDTPGALERYSGPLYNAVKLFTS